MGIFTDENDTEYVQADPAKPPIKSRGNACERELLTEAHIRDDLRRYTNAFGDVWFIVWLIGLIIVVIAGVASWRVGAPKAAIAGVFGGCLLALVVYFFYFANRHGWFYSRAKGKRPRRTNEMPIRIYKQKLVNFRCERQMRMVYGELHFDDRSVYLSSDHKYFSWSKMHKCDILTLMKSVNIGDELYIAMWDDGLEYRVVYPCRWFVLEDEQQEETI